MSTCILDLLAFQKQHELKFFQNLVQSPQRAAGRMAVWLTKFILFLFLGQLYKEARRFY